MQIYTWNMFQETQSQQPSPCKGQENGMEGSKLSKHRAMCSTRGAQPDASQADSIKPTTMYKN